MNKTTIPDKAFILAAGLGSRMRPITNTIPKPMAAVYGKPMIDHALDALSNVGVQTCVINTHYKAEVLHDHLSGHTKPRVIISHESELLDTGGGIFKAIENFKEPFFIISGDSVWEDAPGHNALRDLAAFWDAEKMDILMLLQPVGTMKLTHGVGDYDLDADGRATRSLTQTGGYMWTSIRINTPHIFDGAPEGPFSYLKLMDKAQAAGRLYGIVNSGTWHHISTPADLEAVNAAQNV